MADEQADEKAQPEERAEVVTEILEMTVGIERTTFKPDGYPKSKLYQSAKAAVPRKGTPDQVSADLQTFVRAQLDILEADEEETFKMSRAASAVIDDGQAEPDPCSTSEFRNPQMPGEKVPLCKIHKVPMKKSVKKDGYFCSQRNGDGSYCAEESQ